MPLLKTVMIVTGAALIATAWLLPTIYYGLNEQAGTCIGKSEYDQAINWSNAAIALNPNYGEFYVTRGLAYEWKDQYGQSLADYNHAIQLEPNCAKGFYSRGFTYLFTNQMEKARQDALKSIEIYPYSATAFNLLGRVYDKQGNYAQALDAFKKQVELQPTDLSAYDRLAITYAKLGEIDRVEETQAKINKLKLKSKSSYVNDQQGELKDIVWDTKDIQKHPSDHSLFCRRAETFTKLEIYQQAINDYSKAIALDSKDDSALFGRASAFAALKQYDKAIPDYTECIKLYPEGVAAYVDRGLCYKNLKQYPKALIDYETAISHNENDSLALDNMAALHSILGDHQRAITEYEKAFKINDDAARYYNRGLEYLALGNYDKAYSDFDKTLANNSGDTLARYQRARASYKLGHLDPAVKDLIECLQSEPFSAEAYALLASCYTAQGKMKDAIAAFDQSFQIKPDCGSAHYGRAIMYEKLGMTELAKKEKSAALKLGCTTEA